jgi:hypothetical protein
VKHPKRQQGPRRRRVSLFFLFADFYSCSLYHVLCCEFFVLERCAFRAHIAFWINGWQSARKLKKTVFFFFMLTVEPSWHSLWGTLRRLCNETVYLLLDTVLWGCLWSLCNETVHLLWGHSLWGSSWSFQWDFSCLKSVNWILTYCFWLGRW